jgi:glucose-6-phosphate-specific signal transduction histidine kinase
MYKRRVSQTQSQIQELSFSKEYYETEINALRKDYLSKKDVYQKELRNKYFDETALKDSLNKLIDKLNSADREIDNLKYQWQLTEKAPMLKKDKLSFDLWINEQMIDYYTKKSKQSEKQAKELEQIGKHFKNQLDTMEIEMRLNKLPR